MAYHATSTTGGKLTGRCRAVSCLCFGGFDSDDDRCAPAGSELSFSRWLFSFSLVTTLFFTCKLVGVPSVERTGAPPSFLGRRLRPFHHRGLRVWRELSWGGDLSLSWFGR